MLGQQRSSQADDIVQNLEIEIRRSDGGVTWCVKKVREQSTTPPA